MLARYFPLTLRDGLTTVAILLLASVICLLLQTISATDAHVPLIFVAAVLLVSLLTQGYAFGLFASLVAVLGVNYAFTYPYFELNFSLTGYPLTFIVTFAVSVITCTLTSRVRQSETIRIEAEKEKMRANLLRAISHDFRTPLTGIIGSVNVMLEDEGRLSGEERRALLTETRSDAEWLINMVENLLSITRVGAGAPAALHREVQAAEEVMAEAVAKFRRQYPDFRLEVSAPEELLLVPMDAMLIEQVILNLLINAATHGGRATGAALSLRRAGETAEFAVSDDGVGFPRELLPRLLRTAVPAAQTDTGRNMGIGLMVCSAIVGAHGGTMEAENRPEGGALVRFALPLAEETESRE